MSRYKPYKVSVSISGKQIKTSYYKGLVFATTPSKAKEAALKIVSKGMKENSPKEYELYQPLFRVVNCEKLPDDFLINTQNK